MTNAEVLSKCLEAVAGNYIRPERMASLKREILEMPNMKSESGLTPEDVDKMIQKEGPAILAWFLRGVHRFQQLPPEEQLAIAEGYKAWKEYKLRRNYANN